MENLTASLVPFFENNFEEEILDVVCRSETESGNRSVVLSVAKIASLDEIGNRLMWDPLTYIPVIRAAVVEASRKIFVRLDSKAFKLQRDLHVRFYDLPGGITCKKGFPECRDRGRLVCVKGTVSKTNSPQLLDYRKHYICKKCKHQCAVEADFTRYYAITPPQRCPNPAGCDSYSLVCLESRDADTAKDYQEIRITESTEEVLLGMMPESMWVVLEDDLVNSCNPGDDVSICGILRGRCKSIEPGGIPDLDLAIQATHVEVKNDRWKFATVRYDLRDEFESFWEKNADFPWTARNKILRSFCPQIYGMYPIKLAVALAIAGGVQGTVDSGTKMRGESHLLLVGDPGTGKSQFLKYAAKLCERSVLTTGIGSTTAGLTVSCGHDSGNWQLEPGALVLADGGICCIDEFNSMRPHDLTSIHEAMEQQTISVAKAGMVSKLNTRCTIIAATNPKGHYDQVCSLSVNTGLSSPLLSRFDLVFVLLDNQNPQWDKTVSSFLLNADKMNKSGPRMSGKGDSDSWGMEKMRTYFSLIKRFEMGEPSEEAETIFSAYYQHQRRHKRSMGHTTVRLLESLLRIAQANAKLMWRKNVEFLDAIVAISLMESSMMTTGILRDLKISETSFPDDPESEYLRNGEKLLEALGLPLEWIQQLSPRGRSDAPNGTDNGELEDSRFNSTPPENNPMDRTTHNGHGNRVNLSVTEEPRNTASDPPRKGKRNPGSPARGNSAIEQPKSPRVENQQSASEEPGERVQEEERRSGSGANRSSALRSRFDQFKPDEEGESSNQENLGQETKNVDEQHLNSFFNGVGASSTQTFCLSTCPADDALDDFDFTDI